MSYCEYRSWTAALRLFLFLGLGLLKLPGAGEAFPAPGRDVVEAFTRAARGEPLRYVALGGSITQSGEGWAGDWLRAQFPESLVSVINSGMSATGSSLGIFRVERDVIAHQPDLVAIEYCVNDGGLADEEAVRYMETLVVRLKSLPHPPAIVILEVASRHGVNLARHRKVARHYGLLEVDWQRAVDAHLKAEGLEWEALFSDNVHPNKKGNTLYAREMEKILQPLADEARAAAKTVVGGRGDGASAVTGAATGKVAVWPERLSAKPLLLDARMVPLQGLREGSGAWKSEASLPFWWNRFFQGVLTAGEPGAVLRVPFRGTTAGVLFGMNKDYGSFYLNVDGGLPAHVFANSRGGYSSSLPAIDLPAREHVLTVVLPPAETAGRLPGELAVNGPVKLGYLLVAGESQASREPSPQGKFDPETLKALQFEPVPAAKWTWTGPFPVKAGPDGSIPVDAQAAVGARYLGEAGEAAPAATGGDWRAVAAEGGRVDLQALAGATGPAVAYARTELTGGLGGPAILALEVDYYAHVWLNGERVLALEGPHRVPVFLPVTLRAGANELVLKVGAGSAGFNFRLRVAVAK